MAKNLVTKIIEDHMVEGTLEPGEEVGIRIDQTLLQDATGTMACLQFERMGLDRAQVDLAVQYVDHNVIQLDFKNPDDHRFLQAFAAKYGIHFSRPGNGICHYLHVERFARPGATLVGADSHTTSSGALGSIAIGAGGLDVALEMAGQPFQTPAPKVVGVELTGELSDWVTPKDVILELLRRRGVRGGLGRVFEFYGEGVANIDVTGRTTICNMIAELGATTGIFPSDERTKEWLRMQQREDDFDELFADEGADYDEHEHIELDKLEPLIAQPHSPGNVVAVSEVAGTKAAQVCIGSSVNSGFADLAVAAAVLRDETIYPGLVMTVTPGSRQILDSIAKTGVYSDLVRAGARMLEPVCGPCVGMGATLRLGKRQDLQPKLPRTLRHDDGPGVPHEPDHGCRHRPARRHHGPARARRVPRASRGTCQPRGGRPPDPGPRAAGGGGWHRDRSRPEHRAAA
jgi:aconitate hydratase